MSDLLQPSGRVQEIAFELAWKLAPNADVARLSRLTAEIALAFAELDPASTTSQEGSNGSSAK